MTSIEVVNAARGSTVEPRAFFLPPWRVTALLSALAIAVFAFPGAVPALEFDRHRLTELWRVITGHLTHYDLSHVFWDTWMFAALAALIEKRSRGLLLTCLALSAVAIPVAITFWQPDVDTYRGLSGIDSALFTLAIGLLLREAYRDRRWTRVALLLALAAGFIGKVIFELVTGDTVFVDSSTFTPLPLAHVVGAAVGVICTVPGTFFPSAANGRVVPDTVPIICGERGGSGSRTPSGRDRR